MTTIPLQAKVECVDGACGQSITVVVNPTTQTVTHFVVKDKSLPDPNERLVSVEHVAHVTSQVIRLSCTKDELAAMEPFVEIQYIKSEQPYLSYTEYDSYMFPYATHMETVDIPVEVERVPPGELAVHRGTLVEAIDGHVGEVGELVVDTASGHITHFVLREGHLWGKKEVVLPVSAIDYVDSDTIYLKLDKNEVGLLPAIPIRRSYATPEARFRLITKVFEDPEGANRALEFVEQLHARQVFKIHNAAVLVKDQDGNISVTDTRDIEPKKGRLLGAITGGLIGMLAGPAGAVVGALAGAGAGGVAAGKIDFGFSDKFLENLKQYLKPGTSALVVLLESESADKFSDALSGEEGVFLQQTITDSLVEQFLGESQEAE